jgi:16S rRNA (guanine527-N7)-methyltransferase
VIADLGSGAGFPGLVLAIMGGFEVHLIESTGKKAAFLRAVIEALKLKAIVHQERIEAIRDFRADIITARALKPLPELLGLAKPLMKRDSYCLFLKGEKTDEELTESAKCWKFDSKAQPSLSSPLGRVLMIRNILALKK